MKLTESKVSWVRERVAKYCKLLEIENPPLLILTKRNYDFYVECCKDALPNYRGRTWRRFWGLCIGSIKTWKNQPILNRVICLNIKALPNLKCLDNTIRHELIHFTKPSYNHRSQEFHDRMNKLLKGDIKNGRF